MLMDATMLLPATGTPMTGIDFTKRLPCGETEKARKVHTLIRHVQYMYMYSICTSSNILYLLFSDIIHVHVQYTCTCNIVYLMFYMYLLCIHVLQAMRVFFSIRKLCQSMYREKETYLPLTPSTTSVVTEDVIDTSEY